jgi:antitoxin component of RelBE/YafQ-DinJ toxin-antitoxin module
MTDTPPKEDTKTTLFIREIPEDVKRRFKAMCSILGYTMQDVLITMMREYARNPQLLRDIQT